MPRARVTLWKGRVRVPAEHAVCDVLAGLHMAAAYVYGLLHWPFATIVVVAIYCLWVNSRRTEGIR